MFRHCRLVVAVAVESVVVVESAPGGEAVVGAGGVAGFPTAYGPTALNYHRHGPMVIKYLSHSAVVVKYFHHGAVVDICRNLFHYSAEVIKFFDHGAVG
jgi:hypothetical protein